MSYPKVYHEFYNKVDDAYIRAAAGIIKSYDEFCAEIHSIYLECCNDPEASIIGGDEESFIKSAHCAEEDGVKLADYAMKFHVERQEIIFNLKDKEL